MTPHSKEQTYFQQSLSQHPCPRCKQYGTYAELRFLPDGTNRCEKCGYEVITEWEWYRRQKHNTPTERSPT